ncbi:hypothetical protein HWV07_00930 [Natronomonas salina]|uniref:hypothetical protein n=1 Tax=Natronomonas salina TaxID=1710540 RepID=UPI0015B3DF8C|nr:hypothetical protein [Natronomonas salina]QLD87674.1 hypothetical protein HWV07_00930 [Natronomonas salina]
MPSTDPDRADESRIFSLVFSAVITVTLALLVTASEAIFRAILVVGLFVFFYLLHRLVLAVERMASET